MSDYDDTPTPISDSWFRDYQPADDEEKCYTCEKIVWAPAFEEHLKACGSVPRGEGKRS